MVIDEFKNTITQIQRYYGKEYNEIQINEIYKYFGKMSIARFNFITSKLYQKSKYLPVLADFVEVHKENPYYDFKKEEKKNECDICGGKGFVLYKRYIEELDREYEFAAHCTCTDEFKFDGSKCKSERNKSKYFTRSVEEIRKYI